MTDLEITRLCAEAMELPNIQLTEIHVRVGWKSHWYVYNPLHDDAQAMALGKRYPDEFKAAVEEWAWQLSHGAPGFDLNYCLCGRVANMQQSKA